MKQSMSLDDMDYGKYMLFSDIWPFPNEQRVSSKHSLTVDGRKEKNILGAGWHATVPGLR